MSTKAAARPTLRTLVTLLASIAPAIVAPSALAAAGPSAQGSGERSVAVTAPACRAGWFQMGPFLDSLRVELAGSGLVCCAVVEPGEAEVPASLRVDLEIPCADEVEQVLVEARDASNGHAVARDIAVSDVAQTARPRTLALAVAELIRMLGRGPEERAPPAPPAALASAVRSSPTPAPAPGVAIELQGEARVLPTRSTAVWGGRARLTVPWRGLHGDLDVGGGFASARGDLGEVLLRTASVGVGLGPRLATRLAIIDLGLRGELGWAWVRGAPATPDVRSEAGSGMVASLGLRAAAALPATTRIRPCLAFEGGGVLAAMDGRSSGRAVLGVAGYYLLAALGVGVVP